MSIDLKNGVFAPVLTALLLGVGGKMYYNVEEKLDQINELIEKHPELEETLHDLHNVKVEMQKEYRGFKAKTELRLKELEAQEKADLKPIKARLVKDSTELKRHEISIEFLKSWH
jgi:methylphosphotriester-DNA--protein-cysteine methyltransferase